MVNGARHAIPPLADCEIHQPAPTFISSNSYYGMGCGNRQAMDIGRSPWWVT